MQFADGSIIDNAEINLKAAEYGIRGNENDNELTGQDNRDDIIYGLGGVDYLYGKGGNDTLIGGKGNDKLYGETGDDTFVWNIGDGNDTIYQYANHGNDTLLFGEGITKENITVSHPSGNNNLVIQCTVEGVAANITVYNWYKGTDYILDNVRFADGSSYNAADLEALAAGPAATASALSEINASLLSFTDNSLADTQVLYLSSEQDKNALLKISGNC